MDPFLVAVRRTLSRWQMIAPGERCLVAISGGADSVALLAALRDLGCEVAAAHYNHGWRGAGSDGDEAFVRGLCERFGVVLAVGHGAGDAAANPAGGREQAGRESRYRFLHHARVQCACARIATGHTADDQAETVLLRLLRGSGAAGLAAIRPLRADGVVRPLLEVDRGAVLAYLERRGLAFVEDPSNADSRYTRNRIRLDLLPRLRAYNPRIVRTLGALAAEMAGVAERDEALAAELLRRCGDGRGGLVLSALAPLAPAVRRVAVRAWLGGARGGLRRLGAAHVDAVAACAHSGSRVSLPGGESVTNEHGVLRLEPAAAADAAALEEAIVSLRPGEIVRFGGYEITASAVEALGAQVPALPSGLDDAVVDAEQAAMPLLVRAWRAGDRVIPLGMRGRRKLSDVFIDAKVPRWRRRTLPVVESGGRILWVPGVVRGAAGAVGAYTRRVVRLRAVASR